MTKQALNRKRENALATALMTMNSGCYFDIVPMGLLNKKLRKTM